MSRLIDNIKRLAGMVKNETKSGGNTAARIGGLFEEIAAELEAKYDKTECDELLEKLNRDKLDKTGDGKDVVISFVGAEERENVRAGDTLAMLWGKVWKWFDGLAAVAFSGKTANLTDDEEHRLTTDMEKARWNDTYTKKETDDKDTEALRIAKGYVDNQVNNLGDDVYRKSEVYTKQEANAQHEGDLAAAKKFATDRISELVNGSPAALDTLYEIANALNNDPNFATTIMALINGKADTGHKHTKSQITDFPSSMPASDVYAWAKQATKPTYTYSEVGAAPSNHNHDSTYQPKGSYAAANHNHDTSYAAKTHNHDTAYAAKSHTHSGFITLHSRYLCGGTSSSITCVLQAGTAWISGKCIRNSSGYYTITHNLGKTNYIVILQAKSQFDTTTRAVYATLYNRTANTIEVRTADDSTANDALFFVDILLY